MKSRIWCFDFTLIKKNFTRFAPAWVLYGVMWLLIMVMMLDSGSAGYDFAGDMAATLQIMPFTNCIYALVCAQLLFGDLYNARMCNSLHALPMRREGWFLTNTVSGICFSLLPNMVIMLLSTLFLGNWWVVAPMWLLGMTLQYLFFFGVAVLSAYCVGNRFAMALVYAILNGISLILYALLESLYLPMLYGTVTNADTFLFFSPAVYMTNYEYLSTARVPGNVFILDGWEYLTVCALVGLVFMGFGLLLYRKRNLEKAGDFVAARGLGPVFMLLYCLCGGMTGYLFFSLFIGKNSMFFLVIGMTVGWFTGNMLLKRTVRVFNRRSVLGCGAFLLVFFLTLGLTRLDPLGITRWLPDVREVAAVEISVGTDYVSSEYNRFTDPEDMEKLLDIHRYGLANPEADADGVEDVTVMLRYEMQDGDIVLRSYTLNLPAKEAKTLDRLLSKPEIVLGMDRGVVDYTSQIVKAEADGHTVDDVAGLIDAILLDCQAGTMNQNWAYLYAQRGGPKEYAGIELFLDKGPYAWKVGEILTHYILVCEDDVHTVAFLRSMGI